MTLLHQCTLRVFHCKAFMQYQWHVRSDAIPALGMLVDTNIRADWISLKSNGRGGDKKRETLQTSHRLQTKY